MFCEFPRSLPLWICRQSALHRSDIFWVIALISVCEVLRVRICAVLRNKSALWCSLEQSNNDKSNCNETLDQTREQMSSRRRRVYEHAYVHVFNNFVWQIVTSDQKCRKLKSDHLPFTKLICSFALSESVPKTKASRNFAESIHLFLLCENFILQIIVFPRYVASQ